MSIERTQPMRIQKNVVVNCLRRRPEELSRICPGWTGTAAEFIDAIERHPAQWMHEIKLQQLEEQ